MELVQIGRTGKAHGLQGELKVQIEEPYTDDFLQLKACLLEREGRQVPHFIEQLRGRNAHILKLEQVDDRETAQLWAHCPILVPADQLSVDPDVEESVFQQFIGFEVYDAKQGAVGIIEEVIEQTHQVLVVVRYQGREVYLPLHEDLIDRMEPDQQQLYMDLPEGLLDL